ncbi:TetR/AcrR family transcriptional regulator [Mesobacillus maritimus]|uniref:TetR/AcrR family transcriptional regulator n=1 Tax=Mesobacillus maritimus TaxID=1643336 RepID=UPI00203A5C4D|nr:TetR/AcrR family transcriptional regulator [Mesobacillus maritimus]MCM3668130.1 TetR/AcrR family transcriptional regulator [Mesobacillus maritimus]
MNDRKQQVLHKAHELFINKGFQNTSIQDILDYSRISKGTFYNYFSSKNELLIAIFKSIYLKMEKERNELLIGQNPANLDIFIKQVELQLITNRTNNLLALFEEVIVSNDNDLKEFIQKGQLRYIHWIYQRFVQLFGEEREPFLLDCAIMFSAILQQNLKFRSLASPSSNSLHEVVQYCTNRIVKMVEEVSLTGEQLIHPKQFAEWLPEQKVQDKQAVDQLQTFILKMKQILSNQEESMKYNELLDFLLEELHHPKGPRKYLIKSTVETLVKEPGPFQSEEVNDLKKHIEALIG